MPRDAVSPWAGISSPRSVFDAGYIERAHLRQIADAAGLAPGGKQFRRGEVCRARIPVRMFDVKKSKKHSPDLMFGKKMTGVELRKDSCKPALPIPCGRFPFTTCYLLIKHIMVPTCS